MTAVDLPVTGRLPAALGGRLLRIGPNPMPPPDPATYHWFTGDGMVHGVRLRDGRAEWYRNRWVRGDDVVNTHVIGVAGRTFALVEAGGQPVELTDELDTIGTCRFDGTLDGSFSAHTHRDPATGDLHAVTYHWSWDHIRHVVLGPDAHVRREVQVPVPDGPSVHDCAITERFVVLFDLPVTFNMDAVSAGARFPYRWNPDHPPRVGLLPLEGDPDDVRWFEAPSCYVFHTLNAYDEVSGDGRDRVVVDLVRHPRMFASVLNGPDEGDPVLERWTLDLVAGTLSTETLDDRAQEFPRIDERRRAGPTATATGRGSARGSSTAPRSSTTWPRAPRGPRLRSRPGHARAGLRAPLARRLRRPRRGEDDGWVMSYVYDAATDRSDVVILDAQDFTGEPVATIHLPVRVPFGFHGSWVPDT